MLPPNMEGLDSAGFAPKRVVVVLAAGAVELAGVFPNSVVVGAEEVAGAEDVAAEAPPNKLLVADGVLVAAGVEAALPPKSEGFVVVVPACEVAGAAPNREVPVPADVVVAAAPPPPPNKLPVAGVVEAAAAPNRLGVAPADVVAGVEVVEAPKRFVAGLLAAEVPPKRLVPPVAGVVDCVFPPKRLVPPVAGVLD